MVLYGVYALPDLATVQHNDREPKAVRLLIGAAQGSLIVMAAGLICAWLFATVGFISILASSRCGS